MKNIKIPIIYLYLEGKRNIAKGNGILNSSVTSGCDLFYSIDFDNKVMISDNAILDFIKIINQ